MRNNVTTVDGFKAFRPGTILSDNGGHPVWLDRHRDWCAANGTTDILLEDLVRDGAPFTVLHEPGLEKTGLEKTGLTGFRLPELPDGLEFRLAISGWDAWISVVTTLGHKVILEQGFQLSKNPTEALERAMRVASDLADEAFAQAEVRQALSDVFPP